MNEKAILSFGIIALLIVVAIAPVSIGTTPAMTVAQAKDVIGYNKEKVLTQDVYTNLLCNVYILIIGDCIPHFRIGFALGVAYGSYPEAPPTGVVEIDGLLGRQYCEDKEVNGILKYFMGTAIGYYDDDYGTYICYIKGFALVSQNNIPFQNEGGGGNSQSSSSQSSQQPSSPLFLQLLEKPIDRFSLLKRMPHHVCS